MDSWIQNWSSSNNWEFQVRKEMHIYLHVWGFEKPDTWATFSGQPAPCHSSWTTQKLQGWGDRFLWARSWYSCRTYYSLLTQTTLYLSSPQCEGEKILYMAGLLDTFLPYSISLYHLHLLCEWCKAKDVDHNELFFLCAAELHQVILLGLLYSDEVW